MKYQITDRIIRTQDQFTSFTADQEHEMRRKKEASSKIFQHIDSNGNSEQQLIDAHDLWQAFKG